MSDYTPAHYARCPVCREVSFPRHVLSPCGHDAEPELFALADAGEVYSWTRTHTAGVATVIAMTDFLNGELRVSAPVIDRDEVAIGDRLVVLSSEDGSFVLAAERPPHPGAERS
jgi:uncharacterized OB-fold protein